MGCMNKVFRAEIDVEAFEAAQRTRHGFGGVKMTGLPLPQCQQLGGARLRRLRRAVRLREPGVLRPPGRRALAARPSGPAVPSCFARFMSFFVGALPSMPGPLEDRRQALEAGLREERRAAPPAQLALAERGVAVAVGAERRLGVVHVQAAQPALARRSARSRRSPRSSPSAVRTSNPLASRWQESRHSPSRLCAAGQLDQLAQLLEGAAERVARARGVLEQQRARVRLRERLAQRLADALQRLRVGLADGGAGVEHHAGGADPVARAQRVDQRVDRLLAGSPCPSRRS